MCRGAGGRCWRQVQAAGGRRQAAELSRLPSSFCASSAGSWHKPAISAKNLARLRREALLAGEEWPYDKPAAEVQRRKPKGHKHDREKPLRCGIPVCIASRRAPLLAALCSRTCRMGFNIRTRMGAGCVCANSHHSSAHACCCLFLMCREAAIQKKLAEADKRIAEYRVGGWAG